MQLEDWKNHKSWGEIRGRAIFKIASRLGDNIGLCIKRKPKNKLSTPRREADDFQIVSGYFNNHTTGTPLTILIPNTQH